MNKFILDLSRRKKAPRGEKKPRVREEKAQPVGRPKRDAKLPSARFSLKDQVYLAKRLAYLITAGVSVVESLHILRDQSKGGQKKVLNKVASDVASGQALSKSLAKFPKIFGDFGIHIIKVGESSGTLAPNLAYLADELTKKHELRRKVVGTLVYPAFITVATLGITAVLTVYIFPKIMPIFTSLHVPLPWTTRALIWTSAFLQNWGLLLLGALALLGAGVMMLRARVERVRYTLDWLLIRLPVAGMLVRSYNLANFSRTLALLLKSGVRLSDGMYVVAETTRNLVYREAYVAIAASTIRGEPISRGLAARSDAFPSMLSHMVTIGETTGNLTSTLEYLSEIYEGEVDELTKGLSSAIEPALMIIMGLVVGLIAVSVITPIYEITQHLNPHGG
jgi:type II secretory pathway component PulF